MGHNWVVALRWRLLGFLLVVCGAACSPTGDHVDRTELTTATVPPPVTTQTSDIAATESPGTRVAAPIAAEGGQVADLVLSARPGQGHGSFAAGLLEAPVGTVPGTVSHVAQLDSPWGTMHLVSFEMTLRQPAVVVGCVGEVTEPAGVIVCTRGLLPLAEPTSLTARSSENPGGFNTASGYGGEGATSATVMTTTGHIIKVSAHQGVGYAAWPSGWGPASEMRFVDDHGETTATVSFEFDAP